MIIEIMRDVWRGKSLLRTLMNLEAERYSLNGFVVDVGGGKRPSYLEHFKIGNDFQYKSIDFKNGEGEVVNLEKDKLPVLDKEADSVLCFNVLEHIFDHRHLLKEIYRILKNEGVFYRFVTFMINYHADPHDYFRYIDEALKKLFSESGFRDVEIKMIGKGPFFVNFNNLLSAWRPFRFLLAPIFPLYFLLDSFYLHLRPSYKNRYPLGYFFRVRH